jgi:hypothetical protein
MEETVFAGLGLAAAPEDFQKTESAAKSLRLIREYLKRHQAAYPYEKGMLVWASAAIGEIWSPADQRQAAAELLTLQHEDGGFTLAGLLEGDAEWKRGRFAGSLPSDGYGTMSPLVKSLATFPPS